jgi:RNA polymerase sigma factor (sigma-70 family)
LAVHSSPTTRIPSLPGRIIYHLGAPGPKPCAPATGIHLSRPAEFADDATLVRHCLRNDPRAIRTLVEQFQDLIFGMCVRLLGHRHDAEDVTQEVFLRIFRSLRRWDSARPLKPWVLGIAVNRCRTWMSQRARRPELVEYLHETLTAAPPDDSRELTREIDAVLSELRPEYRLAFVLYHDQGQPYDVIAETLGRPVGTIKTWLHRTRLELLDALRRRGLVDDPPPEPEKR